MMSPPTTPNSGGSAAVGTLTGPPSIRHSQQGSVLRNTGGLATSEYRATERQKGHLGARTERVVVQIDKRRICEMGGIPWSEATYREYSMWYDSHTRW
jgi:hypothetical protein